MEESFNPGRVVAFSLAQSSPSEPGGQGGSLTGVSDQRRRAEKLLVRLSAQAADLAAVHERAAVRRLPACPALKPGAFPSVHRLPAFPGGSALSIQRWGSSVRSLLPPRFEHASFRPKSKSYRIRAAMMLLGTVICTGYSPNRENAIFLGNNQLICHPYRYPSNFKNS